MLENIVNETFNTLKNQGYNFEHNYGLGAKYLAEVFAMLMMLTFLLVDQTQQLCYTLFQGVCKTKKTEDPITSHGGLVLTNEFLGGARIKKLVDTSTN